MAKNENQKHQTIIPLAAPDRTLRHASTNANPEKIVVVVRMVTVDSRFRKDNAWKSQTLGNV
jgi:hypothetical protein